MHAEKIDNQERIKTAKYKNKPDFGKVEIIFFGNFCQKIKNRLQNMPHYKHIKIIERLEYLVIYLFHVFTSSKSFFHSDNIPSSNASLKILRSSSDVQSSISPYLYLYF